MRKQTHWTHWIYCTKWTLWTHYLRIFLPSETWALKLIQILNSGKISCSINMFIWRLQLVMVVYSTVSLKRRQRLKTHFFYYSWASKRKIRAKSPITNIFNLDLNKDLSLLKNELNFSQSVFLPCSNAKSYKNIKHVSVNCKKLIYAK